MEQNENEQQATTDTVFARADVIRDNEARVNVTWLGMNGDLPDPVALDATDADIKTWVTEAVRTGSVPGIRADLGADFSDFVVDRFAPTEDVPWARMAIRPKTPFGQA